MSTCGCHNLSVGTRPQMEIGASPECGVREAPNVEFGKSRMWSSGSPEGGPGSPEAPNEEFGKFPNVEFGKPRSWIGKPRRWIGSSELRSIGKFPNGFPGNRHLFQNRCLNGTCFEPDVMRAPWKKNKGYVSPTVFQFGKRVSSDTLQATQRRLKSHLVGSPASNQKTWARDSPKSLS